MVVKEDIVFLQNLPNEKCKWKNKLVSRKINYHNNIKNVKVETEI